MGLFLNIMLGLDFIFFPIACLCCFSILYFFKKKKNGGEDAEFYFFSFDSFSDIVCIFA
jgi:hypothetical protein